ncbi:hypothetical protein [Clostridium neuense]
MHRDAKEKLEKRQKETSLKTMYFNRFLLVRYVTAGFFFANLYWFCSLLMSYKAWALVPGFNLIFIIRAIWEQCTMFSSPIDNAKKTILAYKVILSINVILLAALFTPLFGKLFPFLTNSTKSHAFILGIIFVELLFCGVMLKRLHQINNRTDRQFQYIKQYEKSIN